jgi:hypothetical protein
MVAGRIPNLINGASDIENTCSDTLRPASATIVTFMSGGCALIQAKFNSMGYAAPGAGGTLSDYLADIEADYAAWRAELARSSPRTAKGERSRADDFRKAYEAALRQLDKMDLSMLGFTPKESGGSGWYAGGISQSDKDVQEADTNRVDAAFKRDGFANPDKESDYDDQT